MQHASANQHWSHYVTEEEWWLLLTYRLAGLDKHLQAGKKACDAMSYTFGSTSTA